MSYEDIEEERVNRAVKEAAASSKKRGRKRKSTAPAGEKAKKARRSEVEVADKITVGEKMDRFDKAGRLTLLL